jgi:tetratricopeptide (TPR) repeat protein
MLRRLCTRITLCLIATIWPGTLISQAIPFGELTGKAREAFLSEDHATAVKLFAQLEVDFGSEEVFTEPQFQKAFLSMYGMSAMMIEDDSLASQKLQAYLEKFYEKSDRDAMVLVGLIYTKKRQQLYSELIPLYEQFLSDYPGHPDTALMLFEKMLIQYEIGEFENAGEAMRSIWESYASSDLRYRARLVTIQQLMNGGRLEDAGAMLLETEWEINSMPELAVLATTALRMGDFYMAQRNYEKAGQAFRWVPFYQSLVDSQRKRLRSLESGVAKVRERNLASRSVMWESHYQSLIDQVKQRLEVLENGTDYTPAFLLKYGRSYLLSDQFPEAWVIFRSLALSESIESEIEEQAWYHWILASHGAENWDEARSLCLRFEEQFPASTLLPKALYMLSRTLQGMGEYIRANEVLSDLLSRFPDHTDAGNWLLARGFNFASLNEDERALSDFDQIPLISNTPTSILVRALYWRGVSLSGLERYEEAILQFDQLMESHPQHWMFPQFMYRKATALYSKRAYQESRDTLLQYLNQFPDDYYTSEARVLLGDVAMGMGRLDEAIGHFKVITTDNPVLFMYAYFQIGKIHRAREEYEQMENLFLNYIEAIEFRGKARVSEAHYWLGWALTQLGRESETLPLYMSTLERYGNDPVASEVIQILEAMELLKAKSTQFENMDESTPSVYRFIEADSFGSWLIESMETAKERSEWTLLGRLQLYEAIKLRRKKSNADLAAKAIQSISLEVPIESMDDHLLGEIGAALAEDGLTQGLGYLRRLLVVYPRSPHKALAYYGLARMELDANNYEDALKWLNLFEKETPNHYLSIPAALLRGSTLAKLGYYESSENAYNDVLRLKQARGEPHVRCLLGLAELKTLQGELEVAIPYYQRIFTLYRAYRPYVAKAYLKSAQLFYEVEDVRSAVATLEEFIAQADLESFDEFSKAKELLVEYELLLLPETIDQEAPINEVE